MQHQHAVTSGYKQERCTSRRGKDRGSPTRGPPRPQHSHTHAPFITCRVVVTFFSRSLRSSLPHVGRALPSARAGAAAARRRRRSSLQLPSPSPSSSPSVPPSSPPSAVRRPCGSAPASAAARRRRRARPRSSRTAAPARRSRGCRRSATQVGDAFAFTFGCFASSTAAAIGTRTSREAERRRRPGHHPEKISISS